MKAKTLKIYSLVKCGIVESLAAFCAFLKKFFVDGFLLLCTLPKLLKNDKGARALALSGLICFIDIIPIYFLGDSMNENKIDIYLFSDRERWPENIAYDICGLLNILVFTYIVYFMQEKKSYRGYLFCFFMTSFVSIPMYFLFYSQNFSIIFIPVLLISLIIAHYRNHNG